jgi:hypothetical protein
MQHSKLTLDLITEQLVSLGDQLNYSGHDLLTMTRTMNDKYVSGATQRELDAVVSTVILLDLHVAARDMPELIDQLLAHIGLPDSDMFNE